MNKCIALLFLFSSLHLSAQKVAWKKLGSAEKVWVVTHPFVAKRAYKISQHVLNVVDSLKQSNYFTGNTLSGSKADAVRHAYWMAVLSSEIGARKSLKLGKAHEKKNRKDFERGELEEAFLPDEAAMEMDLRNNIVGSEIKGESREVLLHQVLLALESGLLWKIKQNPNGDFLNKEGEVIPLQNWSGKWKNERVLVPTSL